MFDASVPLTQPGWLMRVSMMGVARFDMKEMERHGTRVSRLRKDREWEQRAPPNLGEKGRGDFSLVPPSILRGFSQECPSLSRRGRLVFDLSANRASCLRPAAVSASVACELAKQAREDGREAGPLNVE